MRGDSTTAGQFYEAASRVSFEPASPRYYNDQPPESVFYQGLALEKLDQRELARTIFQRLVEYGEEHLHEEVTMDYFAVSLPNFLVFEDDLSLRNQMHCLYLIALGHLGLCDHQRAERYIDDILARDPNHLARPCIVKSMRRKSPQTWKTKSEGGTIGGIQKTKGQLRACRVGAQNLLLCSWPP